MSYQSGYTSNPISTAAPSAEELELTEKLKEALKQYGVFESDDETKKRQEVLASLFEIVNQWVTEVIVEKTGAPPPGGTTGRIFTFGSYRMGVHQQGADIDTLCITPAPVGREDFFSSLFKILDNRKEVTELTSVPDAYVPVIKLEFNGIPIDLLHAKLDRETINSEVDLLDVSLLKALDYKSVLSLNGCRVTDQILQLVPDVHTFRLALRAIKMWAKRRAIYSNAMGFLGGVAWAMMVARVCQLYPNACAATLVSRFFRVYQQWSWPNPVMLCTLQDAGLGFTVWNPKSNPRDNGHLMPIITPAYPAMNSTHNVMSSNLRLLMAEFKRGVLITDHVENGATQWEELFMRTEFFKRYKHYIRIDAIASNEVDHHLWEGLIEARIRVFVSSLERVGEISDACPLPEGFFLKSRTSAPVEGDENAETGAEEVVYRTVYFIGVEFHKRPPQQMGLKRRVDLALVERDFWAKMSNWDKFNDKTMTMEIKAVKRRNLPAFINADRDLTKSTDRNYVAMDKSVKPANSNTIEDEDDDDEEPDLPIPFAGGSGTTANTASSNQNTEDPDTIPDSWESEANMHTHLDTHDDAMEVDATADARQMDEDGDADTR